MSAEQTSLQQADDFYRVGRFEDAERLYQAVVAAEPGSARAWELLGTVALWRNDLPRAEAHFVNADLHANWFHRRWPFNIPATVHRALVHARAGRLREASKLLDRAAGPFPFGPLKELKVRSRQLALFEGLKPYRIEGPSEVVIPFVVTDPLPVVRVAVNGTRHAEFVIDTGAEGLVLDCVFAREVGAVMAGQIPQEYAGGKASLTGYGMVNHIQLGNMAVQNVPVSCIDMQPIGQTVFAGRDIKGVIGTGLLMQFMATLDYPRQQLVLRQYGAGTNTMTDNNEQHCRLPMWLVETHLIFVEGSVNELSPGMMFVDTGLAGAGFHASKDIFTAAGVDMDWSKAGIGAGGGGQVRGLEVSVASVRLGCGDHALRKHDLKGVAFEQELSLFKGVLGFNAAGLISHQFFRDQVVTFDFRNMRLILR